MHVLENDFK